MKTLAAVTTWAIVTFFAVTLMVTFAIDHDRATLPSPDPTPVIVGVYHSAIPSVPVAATTPEPAVSIVPCPSGKVLFHFAEGWGCVSTAPPEPGHFVGCEEGYRPVAVLPKVNVRMEVAMETKDTLTLVLALETPARALWEALKAAEPTTAQLEEAYGEPGSLVQYDVFMARETLGELIDSLGSLKARA